MSWVYAAEGPALLATLLEFKPFECGESKETLDSDFWIFDKGFDRLTAIPSDILKFLDF